MEANMRCVRVALLALLMAYLLILTACKTTNTVPPIDVAALAAQVQTLNQRSMRQNCLLGNVLKQTNPEFARLSGAALIPPPELCIQPPPDGGIQKVVVCTESACRCDNTQECACMLAWCGGTSQDPDGSGAELARCSGLAKIGMDLSCANVEDAHQP